MSKNRSRSSLSGRVFGSFASMTPQAPGEHVPGDAVTMTKELRALRDRRRARDKYDALWERIAPEQRGGARRGALGLFHKPPKIME